MDFCQLGFEFYLTTSGVSQRSPVGTLCQLLVPYLLYDDVRSLHYPVHCSSRTKFDSVSVIMGPIYGRVLRCP